MSFENKAILGTRYGGLALTHKDSYTVKVLSSLVCYHSGEQIVEFKTPYLCHHVGAGRQMIRNWKIEDPKACIKVDLTRDHNFVVGSKLESYKLYLYCRPEPIFLDTKSEEDGTNVKDLRYWRVPLDQLADVYSSAEDLWYQTPNIHLAELVAERKTLLGQRFEEAKLVLGSMCCPSTVTELLRKFRLVPLAPEEIELLVT